MKVVPIILLLFLVSYYVQGQNKSDYQWIFGKDQDASITDVQAYMFNFNEDTFEVNVRNKGLALGGNNASICDNDGNLLFYTNGCAIANGQHEVLPNGHDINEGNFFDDWWGGDCGQGYPGRQEILILPSPSNHNEYYTIHKPRTYDPSADPIKYNDEIRYTIVDLSLDNGLGDVTEKNVVFYKGDKLLSSYMTAVLHQNKKDWWIIQPGETGNTYYTFLLDSSGINLIHLQNIGPSLTHPNTSASGSAKFDPSGTHYGIFNAYTGLFLFDFDRATGLLSDSKVLEVESDPEVWAIFGALEWSSNGRYIYLAVHDRLYQVDSYETDLENGLILVDYWNGVLDPLATTFNMMARGPDCKIYICSNSSMLSYSVIKNPDEKGTDCNLVQQGIKLPYYSSTSSMPNLPNFRIDESEVCDSTITSLFGHPIHLENKLNIYPNPSYDIINIEIPDYVKSGKWEIRDMNDKLMLTGISNNWSDLVVDCSNFKQGVYLFKLEDSNSKIFYQSRFIIII